MNREHILRKIKACLRLAASANPNEAASALRQAQAMMRAHGITHAEALDVDMAEVDTRYRGALPPTSIVFLADMAATAFGSRLIIMRSWRGRSGSTKIRYYGVDGGAEISAFAFVVLRRQLDADRLKHIARVRKRANREGRGEAFAQGWVQAVARLLPASEVSEVKRTAIDAVVKENHPETQSTSGRDLTSKGKSTERDADAGYHAGNGARLHRGVNGAKQQGLEHLP